MSAPIVFLLDSARTDAGDSLAFCLTQHAHETGQIEPLVFAAEADARYLDGQVVLAHRRHMLLSVDGVGHTVSILAFEAVDQISAGLGQRGPQSRSGASLCLRRVVGPDHVQCISQSLLRSESRAI